MEWIGKILEIIKLPIKFIIGIALFSGSLFIIPNSILIKLKLNAFFNNFGTFIGISFYAAVILIFVNIVSYLFSKFKNKMSIWKQNAITKNKEFELDSKILTKITSLDPHEKAVLREFIIQGKHTIELPIDHHVVSGLLNSNILRIVSQYRKNNILIGILTSVSMTEKAEQYIFGSPNLIDIPDGEPTEAEKTRVLSLRPSFIKEIEKFQNFYRL